MLKYLLVGIHVISSIPHLLLVKCNPSLFLPSFFVLETYIQFVGVGMRNSPLQCGRLNCRSETDKWILCSRVLLPIWEARVLRSLLACFSESILWVEHWARLACSLGIVIPSPRLLSLKCVIWTDWQAPMLDQRFHGNPEEPIYSPRAKALSDRICQKEKAIERASQAIRIVGNSEFVKRILWASLVLCHDPKVGNY